MTLVNGPRNKWYELPKAGRLYSLYYEKSACAEDEID